MASYTVSFETPTKRLYSITVMVGRRRRSSTVSGSGRLIVHVLEELGDLAGPAESRGQARELHVVQDGAAVLSLAYARRMQSSLSAELRLRPPARFTFTSQD